MYPVRGTLIVRHAFCKRSLHIYKSAWFKTCNTQACSRHLSLQESLQQLCEQQSQSLAEARALEKQNASFKDIITNNTREIEQMVGRACYQLDVP